MITIHTSMKVFRKKFEEFLDKKYPNCKKDELECLDDYFNSAYAIIIYETGDILFNYELCNNSKRGYDLLGQICETITHEVFHDMFQREGYVKEHRYIHECWDRLTWNLVKKGDYLGGHKRQNDKMTRKEYK